MKKSDILKILGQISDDADIVFLDEEGNYSESIGLIEERILGKFSTPKYPEVSFYASYRHYDNWILLYDRKCAILG